MSDQTLIKTIKILLFVFAVFLLFAPQVSYAVDCSDYGSSMASGESPDLDQLVCPLIGFLNYALGIAAAVLVIMVVYGAIKVSLALGDPKGTKAGYQTWLYAGIGVVVVLGVFAVFAIIANILGLSDGSPLGVFNRLQEALDGLEHMNWDAIEIIF